MVTGPLRIVSVFPAPPAQVRQALSTLAVLRGGAPDAIAELGDITDLPRPWDPTTCPGALRQQVWLWCDDVAAWINRRYSWRPASLIPACCGGTRTSPASYPSWRACVTPPVASGRSCSRSGTSASCRCSSTGSQPAGREHLPHRQASGLASRRTPRQLHRRGGQDRTARPVPRRHPPSGAPAAGRDGPLMSPDAWRAGGAA